MIIVNTGNGKGKTTAAIGQIIRSLGHNNKVCLVQLFKGEQFYGEQNILRKLDGLDFFSYAKKHPFCFKGISFEEVRIECEQAIAKLRQIYEGDKKYDLIVLEEFNIALRDKFIEEKVFLEIVKMLSEKSDIVVTGRGATEGLIAMADIVSEIREIKHVFNEGVCARVGIEY
jgi:cob(I)alamin adenosyltransferase